MDSLDEQEIISIWERNKKYIDINDIKAVSKPAIQEEIRQKLNEVPQKGKNKQANTDFLIRRGFVDRAVNNPNIQRELFQNNIREIKVKGKSRFQIAKGTPTTTVNGKQIRAGRFIAGKDKAEAVKNLQEKVN